MFSGKITAHGKTTSTRFAGYIDTVDEEGTVKIVMLCEKGNFILGNVNVNTHNITIPYVLYADGRVASSPLTESAADLAEAVQSLKQKEGKKSRHSELNIKSEKLNLRNSLERGNFFSLTL